MLNIGKKKEIEKLVKKFNPSEIYFFAGQSSVSKSFHKKKETILSNYNGCKNFLDVMIKNKINCKFLNASSCEIYGNINKKIKINDKKKPISPYGLSKLKSFNLVKNYRKKFSIKGFNAIIFNTESIFRDKNYLIPKICMAAIRAKKYNKKTDFGNLKITREWNWGPEQVFYLFKFLNKKPQDFILSNGKNYKATEMLKFAFNYFNLDYKKFVYKKKKYYRKKDIISSRSDWKNCLKRNRLKRVPKIYGRKLINNMIFHYLNEFKN